MAKRSWPIFYHYTCDHGRAGIGEKGVLRPMHQLVPGVLETAESEDERLMFSLIWVTDLPDPDIDGLGLTKKMLSCERWKHRYRIANPLPLMRFTDMQYRFTPQAQMGLTKGDAKPDHWFVSWVPLPAVYAPIEVSA
jgi:hypothetical protein